MITFTKIYCPHCVNGSHAFHVFEDRSHLDRKVGWRITEHFMSCLHLQTQRYDAVMLQSGWLAMCWTDVTTLGHEVALISEPWIHQYWDTLLICYVKEVVAQIISGLFSFVKIATELQFSFPSFDISDKGNLTPSFAVNNRVTFFVTHHI